LADLQQTVYPHSGHPLAEGRAQDGQFAGQRPPFHQLCYTTNHTGRTQKSNPSSATFVDMLAVRADSYIRFYVTVKQSYVHFITKFG